MIKNPSPTSKRTSSKVSRQSTNSYSVTSHNKKVTNMNNSRKSNPNNQTIVLTREQLKRFEANTAIGIYKSLHRQGVLTDYQYHMLIRNLGC